WKFFRDAGWSHMGVFARTKSWYRDPEIITYFQNRAADGFFKQFDQVVFAGASMGGFGALTFSGLVPGANVVAFNPQTSLDERLVPWETRYRFGQVQDWDLPLGDAAQTVKRAGKAYVFYDPFFDLDRRQVTRLQGDNVVLLKTWFSNHFAAPMLRKLDILKPVMLRAMDGSLEPGEFYRMMRARRNLPMVMRAIEAQAGERHPELVRQARQRFRLLRRATVAEGEKSS
ncbi:MAG: glycosyltransferase family 2 protein, partial [Ruegeria sp.]|nr:glycosyltransferase family 2 protein [Ruegeria sp.]